ncbi:porin [Robbsia andropogonis]|uniref:Porin n=1 Tax=Robbsia andropogonis TaxID=28092 RepID=A0A0F5K061_9BURK|nr:porin [Robbsia andropogonis]KKB63473.1 porin [Robbsia andropogonis]MCP1120384.1 porin [Robbsia andropogonis]MCP1130262.1 porin [Robbsia andropogonis]
MKRFVGICLGILMCSTAYAQSNVTLYGLIDGGISYVSNQGGHSVTKFDDGIYTPSMFGLTGNEDLGGGTSAIFNLQSQFQLGTGSVLQQGIFGRNAYVGLKSSRFGQLTLGNVYDFMSASLLDKGNNPSALTGGLYSFAAGPFQKLGIPQNSTGWFDWSRASGIQMNSSIKYESPVFAGFSFGALYAPGGVSGSFGANSGMSFGANYVAGPFGLGAAYTEKKYAGSSGGSPQIPIRNWGVGTHYVLGPVYLVADLVTVRNALSGATAWAAQAGASWHLTPAFSLGASYMYMKGNEVLDGNHAHQVSTIANYSLSKRTTVYVEGIYQRANSGAQAAINGIMDTSGSSSNASQAIARVGVHTMF